MAEGIVNMDFEGAWTFVPVIITSILAALWSRVEFQACNYIPWTILDLDNRQRTQTLDTRGRQAARTVMLDYPSMGYPGAIYTSLKYRHFFPFSSLIVSVLLRAQIFLSTGLFRVDGYLSQTYLGIRPGNLYTMIALFGVSALFALHLVLCAPPSSGITPRDPTTMAGTAALLANSSQALSKLSGTGSLDILDVSTKMRGPWCTTLLHHPHVHPSYEFRLELFESEMNHSYDHRDRLPEELPAPYRPWTMRAFTAITIMAVSIILIVGLWLTYMFGGGVDDRFSPSETYYFLWSSFVTMVFMMLAIFLACIDFDSRRLTPFLKLVSRDCSFDESMGLAYTNEVAGKTLFKSLRYGDWSVFITSLVAFVAWVLPICTAGLFTSSYVEHMAPAQLLQQTYFQSVDSINVQPDNRLVDDILLKPTPDFPPWTWDELAFQALDITPRGEEWRAAGKRVTASIPAMYITLNCDSQSFQGDDVDDLRCQPFGEDDHVDMCGNHDLVGRVVSSCTNLRRNSTINYVWGSCESLTLIAYMCEETYLATDAVTTLDGDELAISRWATPVPDRLTQGPSDLSLPIDGAYDLLGNMSSDAEGAEGLDRFFATLTRSRLDVPLQRLRSMARVNSVLTGITRQHGIIRAQTLTGSAVRRPFTEDSPSRPAAIETELVMRQRAVIQSRGQTYALTVLLGVITGLMGIWLLIRPRAALPKNPGSIAARASLVADSTIWWHLPKGVEWLSDERLAHRLRKKVFRMGWFSVHSTRTGVVERNYGIGIVQDGRRREVPYVPDASESGYSTGGHSRQRRKGMADATYY
ncbi:hypothetical protein B0I35DRAFT_165364 [Stachybotrys elegans]|uniref:Uncharacterized protein n=1 Tax=Stachybotrys elegans TaxID=80388 RepID=A0A8K0T2T8_9HYPO|nr:hypothetical protein B0I35DRAFT_165364 [Stachybotrys elegans]